jgi:hypothetical protein
VKLAAAVTAMVACASTPRSSEPEDPNAEEMMRNAFGIAVATHPLGRGCQDCLDDDVVKFTPVHLDVQPTARANLDRLVAAFAANDLRLAVRYLDFLFSRFTDALDVLGDAAREVAKHDAALHAFETDCMSRCGRCSSSCRAIDDTCMKFCTMELPGHQPAAKP